MNKWTNTEIELLKDNYSNSTKEILINLLPNHSWKSILTKANNLNINKRFLWTQKEDDLLCKVYENIHIQDVLKLFPTRTKDGIIHRAKYLGLNSFDHPIWTENQKQYLIDNWEKYPDIILGDNLGKTKNAVKRMRNLLGLHRQDKTQRTYENITKYIRGNIQKWKNDSMQKCNYVCVLTGSKDFEIHHLYPVNKIINDIFQKYNFTIKEFNNYSDKELQQILNAFILEQDKYPLGECIRKDLHHLFHFLYGQYKPTISQWLQFKQDFKNGLYNNLIEDVVA